MTDDIISSFSCSNHPFEIALSDIENAVVDGEPIYDDSLSHWWGLLRPVIEAAARRENPHPYNWRSTADYIIYCIGRRSIPSDEFRFTLGIANGATYLVSVDWHGSLSQHRLWAIAYDLLAKFEIQFEIVFELRQGGLLGRFSSEMQDGDGTRLVFGSGRTPEPVA